MQFERLAQLVKNLFKASNFWPIVIVILFSLLAGRTLMTPGYFNMHDDLQLMRQLEMEKCFYDGQIPCRWVPDMGYGFGFPLFNFYPPLPYLVGQVFRTIGFTFIDTIKIVFLLSFLVSGVAMYLLSKEFFGKLGAVVSSGFYIWAPYHSVDIYVRGAMNEAWALSWFPLILWTGYKVLTVDKKEIKRWIIGLALSWSALLLSHNLMAMIFAPVFAGWCLLFLWKKKDFLFRFKSMFGSGILSLGLSAFFTLPAVLEQKYVHVDTLVMGYYEYIAHFANISQLLFSRFWGYGPSVWGENDGMPFTVGHIHWILSLVIMFIIGFTYFKKKKLESLSLAVLYFFLVGWLAVFMIHSRSTFIWHAIPTLKFVQFPWRFLSLVMLSFSFISGYVVVILKPYRRLRFVIPGILLIGLVIFNWNYFLPYRGKMGPLTEPQKFTGAAWDLQRTAGIFDYLPKSAIENPKEGMNRLTEVVDGESVVTNELEGTDWAKFNISVDSEVALIRVGIFQFPNWKVYVDGKEVEVQMPDTEKWGRIYINVPKGDHEVSLKLHNTGIRTISNLASLITWVGLAFFALIPSFMLQFKRGLSK